MDEAGDLVKMVKICPACNKENPVSEVVCRVCMTNLTSVSPTSGEPEAVPPPALTLSRPDGRTLPVGDGDVLGRSGSAFFEKDKTVSRRHAKVNFSGGIWNIEDLSSTNGTWVNGKRLTPGSPCPLNAGDTIALSLSCELKVTA